LHDIGHGPFSHYGKSIVEDVHHEEISLLFMHQLNTLMDSWICRFKSLKGYRLFMLQLISSQLDMDRMDYLKRDSFIQV
jgi:HD superfamily phosphohydrolase